MAQSIVKMMNRLAEMENCILKGLVLDEHGSWISIADRKSVEEDTLAHLSSGQVLFEGRWVNFQELKASRMRGVQTPPSFPGRFVSRKKTGDAEAPAAAHPGITIIVQSGTPTPAVPVTAPAAAAVAAGFTAGSAPDTSLITLMPPEPEKITKGRKKKPLPVPENKPAAPDTSLIIMPVEPARETPLPEKKETAKPDADEIPPETAIIVEVPPPSHDKGNSEEEFAPETKIILFKPPEPSTQSSVPGTSDTKVMSKAGDTKILQVARPVSPDESAPPPKNRLTIVIGTVVVVAAIAAIVVIVMQMAR
jgi:hypothetical protein